MKRLIRILQSVTYCYFNDVVTYVSLFKVHLIHSVNSDIFSCQVEDVLPPVFSVTPKGSGAGYGVGFDLDDLLTQSLTDLQHSDLRERFVNKAKPCSVLLRAAPKKIRTPTNYLFIYYNHHE